MNQYETFLKYIFENRIFRSDIKVIKAQSFFIYQMNFNLEKYNSYTAIKTPLIL